MAEESPAREEPRQSLRPEADVEEEEDGEELIGEDMHADYRPMGALDEYEEDGLDENEYGMMDAGARVAADAELEARDMDRTSRMPAALLDDDDDEEEQRPRRRRREEPEEDDTGADALDEVLVTEDVRLRPALASPPARAMCLRLPRRI
jgi:DNA replication licensing factor MCM2